MANVDVNSTSVSGFRGPRSKKSVLLHIGTMKTGTTSIQSSLARAQASGSLRAVCYPRWKGEAHQSRLAVLYCPDELREWPSLRERYPAGELRFRRVRDEYRRFIFDQLRSAGSTIISSETFSHLFTPLHAFKLREDLESVGFREFHIALYVRDPADYYLSLVQQSLRMSDVPPLIKDPATFRYPFLQMAETWEQVFPGRLIVRRFPNDAHHDVLDDFSALLTETMGVALPRVPLRANASLSAEGMQILQDYRQAFENCGALTSKAAQLATRLARSAHDVPQSRPALKPDVAGHIRANHASDAEALYVRYGVDLGCSSVGPATLLARPEPYRVDEIVESVDPEIVRELRLRVAGRGRERRSPARIAKRVYRGIARRKSWR